MKKKIAVRFAFVITCLMFVIGLSLVFASPALGSNAAGAEIRRHGGSMDTGQYLQYIEGSMASYRTGGFVLSLVGGFGFLGAGRVLIKEHCNGGDNENVPK